jgi:hypothetical protein
VSVGVATGHPRSFTFAPRWRAPAFVFAVPLVSIVGVASANGGYNPTSFGWTALALVWIAIVGVIVRAPAWGVLDVTWIGLAVLLCVFFFTSAAWSSSTDSAWDNGLRGLVYLGAVTAGLVVLRRRTEPWLAGLAVGAGAVCVYSLATRLFPERFGAFNADAGYRLFAPMGYWNALGIFAAIGALTALGVAVLARGRALRIVVAVALVPLLEALYFTFSRGAWGSLVVGLALTFAVSPHRLRLLGGAVVLLTLPALGLVLASRSSALSHQFVGLGAASHAGHRLALELALIAVAQLGVAGAFVVFASRVVLSVTLRRAIGSVVLLAILAALAGALAKYGSPSSLARRGYHEFVAEPTGGSNLNGRLFALSNNNRILLWHSAVADFRAHPLVGSGAGTFGRWWLAHRTNAYFIQDAHNLYLQTLAEGGVVGLLLLAAFLGLPLLAGIRARRRPLVAPALGAFVAYLAHATVDWDWQMPAVTLLALFAGAALVTAARSETRGGVPGGTRLRAAVGVGAAIVAVVAFIGLIGNLALVRSKNDLLDAQPAAAAAQAQTAHRWAPWSAVAVRYLGEARVLSGRRQAGLAALDDAAAKDPGDWQTWLDIAAASTGTKRTAALARAHALNPAEPSVDAVAQGAPPPP